LTHPNEKTRDPVRAVKEVTLALLETIEETRTDGAPEGVLFAALQAQGCSLTQFQSLLQPLQDRGFLQREGHLLRITSVGSSFTSKLRQALLNPLPQR